MDYLSVKNLKKYLIFLGRTSVDSSKTLNIAQSNKNQDDENDKATGKR